MTTDADVLKEVSQFVDVAVQQRMAHYLYFPSELDQIEVAMLLSQRGFVVESRIAADGTNWLVYATHFVVPSVDNVKKLRRELEELADVFRGEYDGWEIATNP